MSNPAKPMRTAGWENTKAKVGFEKSAMMFHVLVEGVLGGTLNQSVQRSHFTFTGSEIHRG